MDGTIQGKFTLAQRILSVQHEVRTVEKLGLNDFHRYKYAKEEDFLDAVKPLLEKHGITVIASCVKRERSEAGNITTVKMKFTLIAADTSEEKDVYFYGDGQDESKTGKPGDKGVYKAMTGAKKYFLSSVFLIPTTDDAERAAKGTGKKGESNLAPTDENSLRDVTMRKIQDPKTTKGELETMKASITKSEKFSDASKKMLVGLIDGKLKA